MKRNKSQDLLQILESLIGQGAHTLELDCDHHELWLSVVEGHTSLGLARFTTRAEMEQANALLARLRKEKAITVHDVKYRLSFTKTESFGEPCWTIRVKRAQK